ncbi:hypothetical protein SKAU_G00124530 [Synaphobranchus kaupii]|uniref:Uncharacterized protein n=1 Tax=Synaphobranchus kaupii TaxID=118154 RepID=A0A9Q1FPC5_SYNKA|nr:hypothetical protein SKAU_G00124530 [Synaphobranchus kaupii]
MRLAGYLQLTGILAVVTSGVCDEYLCPKWAHVHLVSLRCYWMSTLPSSWLKAQEVCQQTSGGHLARVNSTEDKSFILSSFPLGASVWIWVKDGRSRDGVGTQSYQQRERGRESQRLCTQMALGSVGQWKNATCSKEHRFLCEKEVTVSLPSVDTYLTGVPLMTRVYAITQVPVLSTPPDVGQQRVKMMLFPGLWFSHEGQVLSVQLVMKPRDQLTHAKVQILRPYCSPSLHLVPPGCSSLHNPFTCCSSVPLCNTTGGCATGQYWCHLLETCLPVTSPCSPYHSPAGGPTFPLPPRYPAVVPFYHLVADMAISLPPSSEPAHINVVLPEKDISVYPDDILAVQHTGPVGSFLHCSSSSSSPWQQSYLSLQGPEWGGWLEGGLSSVPAGEQWSDGVVCDLRVLYADTLHSFAVSPMLSTDQTDPGGYTYTGTIGTPVRSTQARNAMRAQSVVSGLVIVHPTLSKEGDIHLPINVPTLIVIKILSGSNATSTWSAPVLETGIHFESYCPPELPASHRGCERDTADTWFSHTSVVLSTPGSHILNISALNRVSSQSMSVKLQAHQPVTGLTVQPHGDRRMLVDVSQVFQAMVHSGSSVKYTWVIDNLVQFAYEGQTYSVVFKKPAEYKLNVTAENPVSSQSLEVKLTAETMSPLADPTFHSTQEVIAVNTKQLFTFKVKVDISIGITFWWDFGDNSPGANHSFPPPSESQDSQLKHGVRQIYVEDSISHTYKQPDDYLLRVQVFNLYERKEKAWDFGDGSPRDEGQYLSHVFTSAGRYKVCATAMNTVSQDSVALEVVALAPVSGLTLKLQQPVSESQSVMLSSRPSYFEARVDLQGCTVYKTSYLWEVRRAPGCSEDDRLPLDNVAGETTPLLMLPKHILAVGSYCLKFTVGLHGTPLLQHQSMNVKVVHSELVPIIKGGSHRLWSSHRDLLLDGTESHDPDDGIQEGEPLQYHWDYVIENTNVSLPLSPPALRHGSTLNVSRRILQPGSVYIFTLTVQKAGRLPVSSAQSVTVQREQVLPVTVDCVTCSYFLPFHHSHSRPLALSGHCLSCNGNIQYKWSAEGSNDEVLELNDVTTSTGASSPDLVVNPGVLLDGLNYTFTLNVSQPALELSGTASITLRPHHPPHGGVCTLTPEAGIRLLETVVTYNCSGWVDGDGESAQLRYTLQVEVWPDARQPCRLLTLYRGTQHSFGTLVPLGSPGLEGNLSVITALVLVEDDLGATVTALNRTLTVQLPEVNGLTGLLKNKSQSELWALVQRGNAQEVVPYSIALTSHLNRVDSVSEQDLQDRKVIRENLTRALASLPISSLQDAAQISSALAQCTAVPRELACPGCQHTVLKALGKMISVIGEQAEPGDVTPLDTGRNILEILGSSITAAADSEPMATSGPKIHPGYLGGPEAAVSAYGQAGELMRSLMRSRLRGEEALTLTAPQIRAVGRRSDPADLLCTERSGPCQFYIPRGLSAQLRRERDEVVQILLGIDGDSPLLPAAHPPISTTLAAMEFATPQGRPIPVDNLPPDRAIRVLLPSRLPAERATGVNLTLPTRGSINFTVRAVDIDPHAGLFLSFNFSLLPGSGPESSGQVVIMVDSQPAPSLSQHALMRELNLSLSAESPAVEDTVFLTPLQNSSGRELHVNVSSALRGGTVQASVCVFSSLCQYFSLEQRRWSSRGLSALRGSSPRAAHCLTQHLTLFGASLFVHPDALILLPPPEGPVRNVVAGMLCAVLLLIHLLIGLISHKLDHLDSTRAGLVPLCGQSGRYRYRVLVKTGWARGSGTTAHVGISLYGLNKSGSRHLQREGAFQRNALDDFQVETDANLGEIWKIRIWHDNTGLDPAWFLQHVVVWDRQTDNMYFFLAEDWLSVENEKNDGMVEKEVLASCPQDLQQFSRVLRSQLVCGMFERHLWVSVWERPSHSNFTRAQRVTCCALLLNLYLATGAVWYGAAGSKGTSGPVSALLLVNAETVAVGMTVAVLVFPLHLLFCFLFRMTASSKVTVDESTPPSPVSQTVEMDVYLSHSEQASSYFLSLPGGLDSILDGVSHSSESLGSKQIDSALWNASKLGTESRVDQWPSCDSIFDLPELQGVPPLGHARLLKRKKALLQLRLGSPACTPDQPHSLSIPDLAHSNILPHNPLTLSEEDLIQSIATGAAVASSTSSGRVTSDSGRYSPCETALSDSQESSCSGWSELSQEERPYRTGLYKSPSSLSVFTTASTFLPSPSPDILGTSSTTRIGVARRTPGRLLPCWVLGVTYLLVGLVLGVCLALVGLYGSSFSSSVLLMWLISAVSAFLTSALLLEPLKVCIQALFLAAVVRPVDPEVEVRLGQEAVVRKGAGELGGKVRPPCGYGLLHAKVEARKVRTLRSLMKSCLVHMLFLLVVLLVNYQDSIQAMHGRLLHSAVKSSLLRAPPGTLNLSSLTRCTEAWQWMDSTLVPYLYQSPSLLLLGLPRIQRVQSQDGCCGNATDIPGFRSALFAPVAPASSHAPSGEQRDSAHSSCSGRLLSWLWQRPHREGAGGVADTAYLGNSSELTRQLLSALRNTRWIDATTKAVCVDFTQYHRETALFVAVTITLEWPGADAVLTTVSIEPFHVPPSHSGPDLQIAMMVLLLAFALSFLGSELRAVVRERGRSLRHGRQCLQLLVSVLSLATAALRISFLYKSASCLSQHGSYPQTFTNFHSAALLARVSSQLSALLLTLLVLKMVGVLRFVRRWVVFGRVLLQAWSELCGVVLMLVLVFLVFSHTGSLLFSSSVEGFRTLGQASLTLVSALRGRAVTQRLCERHPMLGPLYCLSLLGTGLWVVGRLCGAMLMRSYRAAQAEMYRPAMEPQDYDMVEFFIKRLKLWMGLSKSKEFRHKVKFEGMVSPPSRSSLGSQLSCLSAPSPVGPRLASAQSLGSEDSSLSDSYDVQFYLDRLLPAVNNMLSQFDRVNQLTDDLHCIELKLQGAQTRIAQKRKQKEHSRRRKAWRMSASTPPPRASASSSPLPPPSPPLLHLPSLPSFLSCNPTIPCTRTIFSESTLPWHSPHLRKAAHPAAADAGMPARRVSGADAAVRRIPGRRAWHSGTSHSADAAQRSPQAACGAVRARPWSEEGGRSMACDRAPVKRRAWHPEGPEIVGSTPGSTANHQC